MIVEENIKFKEDYELYWMPAGKCHPVPEHWCGSIYFNETDENVYVTVNGVWTKVNKMASDL